MVKWWDAGVKPREAEGTVWAGTDTDVEEVSIEHATGTSQQRTCSSAET